VLLTTSTASALPCSPSDIRCGLVRIVVGAKHQLQRIVQLYRSGALLLRLLLFMSVVRYAIAVKQRRKGKVHT
jgi:hypothetical protein